MAMSKKFISELMRAPKAQAETRAKIAALREVIAIEPKLEEMDMSVGEWAVDRIIELEKARKIELKKK